jgi:hypothetical protein
VDYKLLEDMHTATASKFAELSTKAHAVGGGMAALKVRCWAAFDAARALLSSLCIAEVILFVLDAGQRKNHLSGREKEREKGKENEAPA